MPIYAYKCASCGYAKDALQKISDAPLTVCPQCGKPTFQKQVTAAGFQLKGTGWYVTDFRNGSGGASVGSHGDSDEGGKAESGSAPARAESGEATAESKSGVKPDAGAKAQPAQTPSRAESAGGGAASASPSPAAPASPSSSSSSSGGATSGD